MFHLKHGIFCLALCPAIQAPSWSFYRQNDRAMVLTDTSCQSWVNAQKHPHPRFAWLQLEQPLSAAHYAHSNEVHLQKRYLRQLQRNPDPESFDNITSLFLSSRLAISPEDPDVFERAALVLAEHARLFPEQWGEFRKGAFPRIIVEHLIRHAVHRYGAELPPAEKEALLRPDLEPIDLVTEQLKVKIEVAWSENGLQWLDGWKSENGALGMQTIRLAIWLWSAQDTQTPTLNSNLLSTHSLDAEPSLAPPEDRPSIDPDGPPISTSKAKVVDFPAQSKIPWLILSLGAILGLLSAVFRWLPRGKWRSVIGAFVVLFCGSVGLETLLILLGIPPLSQQQPLFSLQEWHYQIFHPGEHQGLLVTQGGPSRYQWIDTTQPTDFQVGIVGASSAHGSNLLFEDSFGELLQSNLQNAFPQASIQVINGAIGGTTSNGVLSAGTELIMHGIDYLIVYYGHNETAQLSNLTELTSVNITQLDIRQWLSQNRIYSFVFRLLRPDGSIQQVSEDVGQNAALTFNAQQKLKAIAVRNMRHNLQQLIQQAEDNEIPVLIINPSFHFPFVQAEPFEDRMASQAAMTLLAKAQSNPNDVEIAREAIEAAIDGSPTDFEARWHLIEILRAQDKGQEAQRAVYQLLDVAKGITTVTKDIRMLNLQLAEENGLSYLDLESLFYSASQDQFTVNGLFWDELHPSVEGHFRIAQAITPHLTNYLKQNPCQIGPCEKK